MPNEVLTKRVNIKEGAGAGIAEGLLMTADPIGIPIMFVSECAGYDIRTLGGIGLFGLHDPITEERRNTLGKLASKVLVGTVGVGCWLNPDYFPYMVALEVASTALNVYANVRRKIHNKNGTLKFPST